MESTPKKRSSTEVVVEVVTTDEASSWSLSKIHYYVRMLCFSLLSTVRMNVAAAGLTTQKETGSQFVPKSMYSTILSMFFESQRVTAVPPVPSSTLRTSHNIVKVSPVLASVPPVPSQSAHTCLLHAACSLSYPRKVLRIHDYPLILKHLEDIDVLLPRNKETTT